MTSGDIIPEMIYTGIPVVKCLNVLSASRFTIIGEEGSVTLCELEGPRLVKERCASGFRPPCREYFSLPNSPFLWGYGVRDLQIYDLERHALQLLGASHCGNDMIVHAFPTDRENLILNVEMYTCALNERGAGYHCILYDARNHRRLGEYDGGSGILFPLSTGTVLRELFRSPENNLWQTGSPVSGEWTENAFTEELTGLGVAVWPDSYSLIGNLMVGNVRTQDGRTSATAIQWEDEFERIVTAPLTAGDETAWKPGDRFEISPDVKWMKTVSRIPGSTGTDLITFFGIGRSFPSRFSGPVFGGRTLRTGGGCFIETRDRGTVYLDPSCTMPGYLALYKMSDVAERVDYYSRRRRQG